MSGCGCGGSAMGVGAVGLNADGCGVGVDGIVVHVVPTVICFPRADFRQVGEGGNVTELDGSSTGGWGSTTRYVSGECA